MKVLDLLTKKMEAVLPIFQMVVYMKEISKMINLKESENLYGKLAMSILEIGKKEKWMELENLRIEMGIFYKDNLSIIIYMIMN